MALESPCLIPKNWIEGHVHSKSGLVGRRPFSSITVSLRGANFQIGAISLEARGASFAHKKPSVQGLLFWGIRVFSMCKTVKKSFVEYFSIIEDMCVPYFPAYKPRLFTSGQTPAANTADAACTQILHTIYLSAHLYCTLNHHITPKGWKLSSEKRCFRQ